MQTDITQLLVRWGGGDQAALDHLLPLVYDQLKQMAHAHLRKERADHTLNATALVHEAYLKLIDAQQVQWKDRVHFLAIASRVMRRVLVDYALQRKAQKRGGGWQKVDLEEALLPDAKAETVLEFDDALKRLEEVHPRPSKAAELYYFGGLTLKEVGEVLAVSHATVIRDLRFAKAWLAREWGGDLGLLR